MADFWGDLMENTINTDDLIFCVINESQKIFKNQEQRYIGSLRLNKLTILVSEELERNDIKIEGFVWGYYRHGFYSRSVGNFLKLNFGEQINLSQMDVGEIHVSSGVVSLIRDVIVKLHAYFVRNKKVFTKWIYGEITPPLYRDFYLTNKRFEACLEEIRKDILENNSQITLFGEKDHNISEIISKYYLSLEHVNDEERFELFRKFTDIVELVILKWNNGFNPSKVIIVLDQLLKIYKDLFAILTPYLETLRGDERVIEKEILKHKRMVQVFKVRLNNELDELYEKLEMDGLMPTLDELSNEIEGLYQRLPENSKSIKELYDMNQGF